MLPGRLLLLACLTAAFLLACAGGGSVTAQRLDCAPLRDLTSYRYTLDLRMKLPDSASQALTGGPFAEMARSLLSLLGDTLVQGAYRAPDRHSLLVRAGDLQYEVRSIGDRTWQREGGGPWQEGEDGGPSGLSGVHQHLQGLCDSLAIEIAPLLEEQRGERETVNGIPARHYSFDETDLQSIATPSDLKNIESFTAHLWLAEEGSWPVKLQVEAAGRGTDGQPGRMELTFQFSDVNSPDVRIEPPTP